MLMQSHGANCNRVEPFESSISLEAFGELLKHFGSLGWSVFQQKFGQLLGMIDHKFVSGIIDGPDFPAFGFRPFVTDQKVWVAFCRKHIGNILDVFKIACELDAPFKSCDCLWSALCVNPCNVVRVANSQ